jgi:hypothetical protein
MSTAAALATVTPIKAVPVDAGALLAQGIQSGLSVDALERLLTMRRELQTEQARASFFGALSRFQAQIPAIPKNQIAKVTSQKGNYSYRYADLADIQRAIAPALADCGLSVSFDTTLDQGGYVIFAKVHHVGGHTEATTFRVPIDSRSGMNSAQAAGSALTYGRRYALTAALGIVTAEDDDDGHAITAAPVPPPAPTGAPQPGRHAAAPISAAQHKLLEARITAMGLDRDRLKNWLARAWHVQHLAEIPADKYAELLIRLETWAARAYAEEQQASGREDQRGMAGGLRRRQSRAIGGTSCKRNSAFTRLAVSVSRSGRPDRRPGRFVGRSSRFMTRRASPSGASSRTWRGQPRPCPSDPGTCHPARNRQRPGTATGDRAMNTALQISHPQNLDAVLRLTDADLFTPEMLTRALEILADVAGPLVADVAEEQGRREINRITRAVGGAIARLDERRRAYVAALKAQPKAIDDLFRVTFRQPAEALKEQVRAPLTAWEEDMRAADDETTRLVELLNAPVASGTTAAAIRQRLDAARELALPDWLSATQRGAIVAAMERNLPRLEAALEAASRAEAQAAELARLRAVARDAELLAARTVAAEEATRAAHAQQAAREEQIRQEAAATARAAALAEVAQRRRASARASHRTHAHRGTHASAHAQRATGARRPRLDPSRHPRRSGGSRHPQRDGEAAHRRHRPRADIPPGDHLLRSYPDESRQMGHPQREHPLCRPLAARHRRQAGG